MLEIENQKVFFETSEDMHHIPSESITLVVTSPPYWNVRDYGGTQIGFNQSYNEYVESLNRVWSECIRVLQPNGKISINVQPLPISAEKSGFNRRIIKNIMFDIEKFMFKQGLFLSGMIYWNKTAYINNVSWGSYPKPTNIAANTAFEQIYTFVKPGKTRKIEDKKLLSKSELSKDEWRHWAVRMIWDDISPVIKINPKGINKFGHSAPFPEDIPYRLIKMHTIEGETVLDPFLGSGTTLKMARLTKRKGIGFEINQEYKNLIRDRIMEDWNPPIIDPQYKTLSSKNIAEIIDYTLNHIKYTQMDDKESRMLIVKGILKKLKRDGVLTSTNVKHIMKRFQC
ncbi:MAG: DNA-methyltransferase [Promethearchaeota archaeon]